MYSFSSFCHYAKRYIFCCLIVFNSIASAWEFSNYLGLNFTTVKINSANVDRASSYELGLLTATDAYAGLFFRTGLGMKVLEAQYQYNDSAISRSAQTLYWDVPAQVLYKANDLFSVYFGFNFQYLIMENADAKLESMDSFTYHYSFGLRTSILPPHFVELNYVYDGTALASNIDLGKSISLRYVISY